MSKIATETEARTIGGQGTAENGRMCTKARVIDFGCNVASSYADNQLVQYEHLSKFIKPTIRIALVIIDGYMKVVSTINVYSNIYVRVSNGASTSELIIRANTDESNEEYGNRNSKILSVLPVEDDYAKYIY